ncbi:MAG: methionine--tRNA ligase [Phycisphaerae bacterium]|jgi:methionyl-tRNA synthetase|nr:methionine--tRNA ligase [Phycisphaerae bacterium]
MSKTYYVTTPIYYVNDVPHIGHSYTTIAADVLARYFRADGRDVRFLTGTDEHGIKIVKAAAERSISPKELADEVVVGFQDLWKDLNISNDDFIRTSQERHERRVQAIITRLIERDEIYLGQYKGWYDEGQEEFITESAAAENEYKSVVSGKPLVRYEEPTYYFRLSKWVDKLIEYIGANPGFIQPVARRNEVLSKLKMGVADLSISRLKEKLGGWGIEMPNDPAHSVYVWIDALSNYRTALGWPEIGDEHDGAGAEYWPADVHLIGKDILWFHTVYWPAILMALDEPVAKSVFAHGWWTSEGKKMSKTLGNFISRETIAEICQEYSVDVYRYFLLRAVTFGADGDFSHDALEGRYNNELANGLGNLLNRTLNMINRYFDGQLPAAGDIGSDERVVQAAAADLRASATGAMENCCFGLYLDKITELIGATNRYIDATAPFKLAKDASQVERLGTILYTCAEAVRIVLTYLTPFMPEMMAAGLEQLNWQMVDGQSISEAAGWGRLTPGTQVRKPEPLFPRKS